MENKRLYRSSTNYMICGVCGGIGEYFNIDPTLVRLAWVIFSFMGGSRNPCVHHRIDHHSEIKNNVNRKRKKGHTSREKECDFFYGKREKDKPGGYRKDEPGRADEI